MASGRLSLKIDSPLRDMLIVLRNVPTDAGRTALKFARAEAQPIWKEETAGRALSRIQQRVLVDSSRVGSTSRNVFLRAGAVGRLSSGTPVDALKVAAEFGMNSDAPIVTTSRRGKVYTRRAGYMFGPRTRSGKVFFPAVREASARITSVIIQSFARALYDALEGKR